MTAPDIDVRPRCHPTPAKAGGAGGFALARLLLQLRDNLRQLDRKLLLLLAASSLSACVIPVAPEFQDPLGIPDSPPKIVDTDPGRGLMVSTPSNAMTFRITVADPNGGDTLFVRFLSEFPPNSADTRLMVPNMAVIQPRENNQPVPMIEATVDCNLLNKAASLHPITAVIADRDFQTGTSDRLAVKDSGQIDSVNWFLNLTCPASAQ